MRAGNRCRPTLASKPWEAVDQHTADETNKEDPTKIIPVWLQPFTDNLEDLETHVPAHSSERANSDSEGEASKVETQKRKHSVHAYFRKKTKEIYSATRKVW